MTLKLALRCFFLNAGKLFGRGSTDDKGPVLAWFNVIEAFQKIGQVHILNRKQKRKSLFHSLNHSYEIKLDI